MNNILSILLTHTCKINLEWVIYDNKISMGHTAENQKINSLKKETSSEPFQEGTGT